MSASPDAPPDDAPRTWVPDRRGVLRNGPPQWEQRVQRWNRALAEAKDRPDVPTPSRRAYSRETARPFAEARIDVLRDCVEQGMTIRGAADRLGMEPGRLRTWLGHWPELGGPEIREQLKANGGRR